MGASKRIHIDDLYPDYREAMKQDLNIYYFNKYNTVWKKRYVQNKPPKIVITGTLWASGDFIALVIADLKKKYTFFKHPKYKYTWIAKDEKGNVICAIIQVPALDYETGKSSCPEIKSTKELLEEKESMDEYLWETNFQQIPTDPESLFFSYNKFRLLVNCHLFLLAAMAQVAEHILGKDEVTSSNLVSSSIKIPEIKRFRGFLLL